MRETAFLRSRYRTIFNYFGLILLILGLIYLVPGFVVLLDEDSLEHLLPFLLLGIGFTVSGLRLWQRDETGEAASLSFPEGTVLVTLIWVICIISGAIPFMWISNLSFIQALFESTSGWTTTGLSVIDVNTAPNVILFYRSFIQLVGGAGLAIIALSAIAGPIGRNISSAEGRSEQLAPHVRSSANIILTLYAAMVSAGVIALVAAGMSFFDAINHSFSAFSTGGFSTRAESIGYWDNAAIEAVIIVLMIFGATNFLTMYTVIRGKWRVLFRVGELRLMFFLIVVGAFLLAAQVTVEIYDDFEKSIRVAVFEIISVVSTTGFTTTSFNNWPPFGWLLLLFLMMLGGGSGSTAGGIKLHRIYILYRAVRWEFERAFLPNHMVNTPIIWHRKEPELLEDHVVRQAALYIGIYITFLFVGTGILTSAGYALDASLFEFASSVGTVGLSIGITDPDAPISVLAVQMMGMLLGRLEFFAVIIGIIKLLRDIPQLLVA